MQYHTALLIGRFQPFHKGHLYLVKKALEKADKLVFGIGSANIGDENNPLDYETRRKIIKAVIYKEKIENRVIKTVPLDDFFNDIKWLNNVKKEVGDFDLVIGNNDWTNNIMERAGYVVKRFPYYKRHLYEGWRIRKLIKEGKSWENRIPDYLIFNFKFLISKQTSNFQKPISKFSNVVLGGTFDRFHKGHKAIIDKALEAGKKLTIGLATEKLYKNKLLNQSIQSYKEREKELKKYLPPGHSIDIIPFSEYTGGADKNNGIDAIVVSKLTYPNALKINELRERNNLKKLRITIIDDVLAEDGKLLSSERIRAGEIDQRGKVYLDVFKKTLFLPENLREKLRRPFGKVFDEVHKVIKFIKFIKPVMKIAVGDIIAIELEKEGLVPDVKIIDFRTRRQVISILSLSKGKNLVKRKYINQPGTVNHKSAEAINVAIKKFLSTKKQQTIVIDGEEDLLALPAILFAPLNSLVLYGHWLLGVVGVEVTEKIKDKIVSLIKKFD